MIFRRFYSEAPKFDISSYVSRIQTISKNQKGKVAATAVAGAAKPEHKGPQKPRQGPKDLNKKPFNKSQSRSQTKPQTQLRPKQGASAGQPQGQRQNQFQKPAVSGAASTDAQRPKRPTSRPPVTEKSKKPEASEPLPPSAAIPPTSFTQTVMGGPLHTKAAFQRKPKAPHQKPKQKKRAKPTGQQRIQTKRTPQQQQQIQSGLPLVYPVQETLNAVLASANSGFIEVDDMSPRSIAQDLVPGPTFNARLWSVINQPKGQSEVAELVDRRVKGQYSLVKDDETLARVLNGNPTLTGEHKQFLARVAAGQMPPSQVKQVRM